LGVAARAYNAGLLVFLRVVLGKPLCSGGVFVVMLWWIAW